MMRVRIDWPLKIGLLIAALSWLSYVFYNFNVGIFSRHVNWPAIIEDIPGVWGLGFRTAAAAIAVITVVLFVIKREFSKSEAITAFRFVLVFEALYFAAFIGAALNVWKRNYLTLYPVNLFSFIVTLVGLLLLTVYAADFSIKSLKEFTFEKLDVRKIA